MSREWIEGPVESQGGEHDGQNNVTSPAVQSRHSPSAAGVSTNANSTMEAFGISPVHQSHEMTFNLDHETNRIKMMGASSSQTLMKSLDVYLKSAQRKPLSSHFMYAMRHSEEAVLPLFSKWPTLPNTAACDQYMNIFFTRIHCLYPLFDIDHFKSNVRRLSVMPDPQKLPAEQVPLLMSAYLVVSLGADETAQKPTSEGDKYLQAATSLLSHVILMPYLASVQSLLLFTIAYRGRNKDGVAWQALGMAIRIGHTLGLHRFSSVHPSSQHAIQVKYQQLFHARVWGICCCLEKTMQLESGRPSAIEAVDRDQMMGPEQRPPRPMHDFLQWHVGLAEFQGQISCHIYGHKPGSRSTGQLLGDTAKLDAALLEWANGIPIQFRPGSDILCSNKDFHAAVHLSMQYHQSMIALHRAALVAPVATFQSEVSARCPDHASQFRLTSGESICVNSARSIARLAVEMEDRKVSSRLLTVSPSILACIVLSIYLVKTSSSRLQASDLELLRACAESTSEQCLKCGMDSRFAQASIAMYDEVRAFVETIAPSRSNNSWAGKAVHSNDKPQPHPVQSETAPPLPYDLEPSQYGSLDVTPFGQEQSQQIHVPQGFADATSKYVPLLEADDGVNKMLEQDVPFTGLNVEDLWNWMLITDVTGGTTDDLQWIEQASGQY